MNDWTMLLIPWNAVVIILMVLACLFYVWLLCKSVFYFSLTHYYYMRNFRRIKYKLYHTHQRAFKYRALFLSKKTKISQMKRLIGQLNMELENIDAMFRLRVYHKLYIQIYKKVNKNNSDGGDSNEKRNI